MVALRLNFDSSLDLRSRRSGERREERREKREEREERSREIALSKCRDLAIGDLAIGDLTVGNLTIGDRSPAIEARRSKLGDRNSAIEARRSKIDERRANERQANERRATSERANEPLTSAEPGHERASRRLGGELSRDAIVMWHAVLVIWHDVRDTALVDSSC